MPGCQYLGCNSTSLECVHPRDHKGDVRGQVPTVWGGIDKVFFFLRKTRSRYDYVSRGRAPSHDISRGGQIIPTSLEEVKPDHVNLNKITQPLTSHEVAQSDHTPHEGPKPYHLNVSRVSKPYHLGICLTHRPPIKT